MIVPERPLNRLEIPLRGDAIGNRVNSKRVRHEIQYDHRAGHWVHAGVHRAAGAVIWRGRWLNTLGLQSLVGAGVQSRRIAGTHRVVVGVNVWIEAPTKTNGVLAHEAPEFWIIVTSSVVVEPRRVVVFPRPEPQRLGNLLGHDQRVTPRGQ